MPRPDGRARARTFRICRAFLMPSKLTKREREYDIQTMLTARLAKWRETRFRQPKLTLDPERPNPFAPLREINSVTASSIAMPCRCV